jgi:hypothetical protein
MTSRHIIVINEEYDPGSGHTESTYSDDIEIDYIDEEDDENFADAGARVLVDGGVTDASSSHFHPGIWYSTYPEQGTDGNFRHRTYHLKGFIAAEEEIIFRRLMRFWGKAVRQPPGGGAPPAQKTEKERWMDFMKPPPLPDDYEGGGFMGLPSWKRGRR